PWLVEPVVKSREDPLIKKGVDQKKDDLKSPRSVRPAVASRGSDSENWRLNKPLSEDEEVQELRDSILLETIENFKENYNYSMIKKFEEGSNEKMDGLDDPKHVPEQFISLDLDNKHPESKEAVGRVAVEVSPGFSDKTSGFNLVMEGLKFF
ncbi:hypothetical protein Tco_0157375, partial [Tanacetum coccineum]